MKTNKTVLGKQWKNSASAYHNVSWDKNRSRWIAHISVDGKPKFQKRFKYEDDAARHVNWIIDELNLTDRPRNIII